MSKYHSPKIRKPVFVIIASVLVVVSLPLVVWGMINIPSLDTRSSAQELSLLNPKCIIQFSYVDPNSLEIDKAVTLQAIVNPQDEAIQHIEIFSTENVNSAEQKVTLLDKEYSLDPELFTLNEQFTYTPTTLGRYALSGNLQTVSDTGQTNTYQCYLSGGSRTTAQVIDQNLPPEFVTTPPSSTVNNITVGNTYQYRLEARDVDSTTNFGYSYSFTPNADWLHANISSSTSGNGTVLTIDFSGVATTPASYLANVIIWDGYNGHTTSQTWVISVNPASNDTPVVTVTQPTAGTSLTQGQTLEVVWSATDLNQIVGYKLYIASNPGNQNTWIRVDENISYTVGRYLFNTKSLNAGTYTAIVQATDNQSPAATGTGTSGQFTIIATATPTPTPTAVPTGSTTPTPTPTAEPDDGRQTNEAQILNVSPADKSTVKNPKVTISASLLAAENAKINKDTIKFSIDGEDLSTKLKLNFKTDGNVVLNYTPTEDLKSGEHKIEISFEDDKGNKAQKTWTFTLQTSETGDDMITIFGKEYPKKTVIIFGLVLLGILILVILVPWLVYSAIRGKDDEYTIYTPDTPPTTPSPTNFSTTYSSYYDTPDTAVPTSVTETQSPTADDSSNYYSQDYLSNNSNTYGTQPVVAQDQTEDTYVPVEQPDQPVDTQPAEEPVNVVADTPVYIPDATAQPAVPVVNYVPEGPVAVSDDQSSYVTPTEPDYTANLDKFTQPPSTEPNIVEEPEIAPTTPVYDSYTEMPAAQTSANSNIAATQVSSAIEPEVVEDMTAATPEPMANEPEPYNTTQEDLPIVEPVSPTITPSVDQPDELDSQTGQEAPTDPYGAAQADQIAAQLMKEYGYAPASGAYTDDNISAPDNNIPVVQSNPQGTSSSTNDASTDEIPTVTPTK